MRKAAKLSWILVVCIMAFLITGCSNKEPDGLKGTYYFVYEKGPMFSADNLDYTFTLDGYGKGEYYHKGATHKIKYQYAYDGTIFVTDTITGIKYNGTLIDGELHLYDGNPESITVTEFLYQKK